MASEWLRFDAPYHPGSQTIRILRSEIVGLCRRENGGARILLKSGQTVLVIDNDDVTRLERSL